MAGKVVLAVYSPYIGKLPAEQHRAFLQVTVDEFLHACNVAGCAGWMAGDFNLRGLASGGGHHAVLASQLARMSSRFAVVLQRAGLHVVSSPATHSMGGTLVIHITGIDGSVSADLSRLTQFW